MAENTIPPFHRPLGENLEERFETLLNNLEQCLHFISQCPIIDGRLIEGFVIAGGAASTSLKHKLGRTPKGWALVRWPDAAVTVYEISRDTETLVLDTNSAFDRTVDLWVF